MACSSLDICKEYDHFYFEKYSISSNCTGSPQGKSRKKIFNEYYKQLVFIDSSLIVIEQLNYSLGTDFISNETIFIKDYKFDKMYKYIYKEDKDYEFQDVSGNYGQTFGKPNFKTVNIILDKIKSEGLESVRDLIEENNGGVEGNTKITIFDRNLKVVDGIRLKRQLRFFDKLPLPPARPSGN